MEGGETRLMVKINARKMGQPKGEKMAFKSK